jgi:hypothetical protein
MSLYFYLFLVFSVYTTVLKGIYLLRLLDCLCVQTIEELTLLKGPQSSSFCLPRNLSNHMDRQAHTSDIVLVKSRDARRVKTTENKTHWPRSSEPQSTHIYGVPQCMSPVGIGTPPSPASERGSPNSDDWRKA